MKYIDAEKLIKSVNNYQEGAKAALNPIDGNADYYKGKIDACEDMRWFIASHHQEQPDFPTTDEQVKEFLATHPKIKVPEKYKNPDWLFKKHEQPEVDLKKEIITQWSKCNPTDEGMGSEYAIITVEQFDAIARHFYELGLNARKEE